MNWKGFPILAENSFKKTEFVTVLFSFCGSKNTNEIAPFYFVMRVKGMIFWKNERMILGSNGEKDRM
ncbi:hypothetical protein AMR47_03950 [Leptospira interrogans]|nr:hypothetical protein AMR47_03950 [Leptospira interrogans]